MVNLETAITTGGTPAPGKQFTFRAPAAALTALKAAGVDVASMANNHGMDYMQSGLADSLAAPSSARSSRSWEWGRTRPRRTSPCVRR